MTDELPPMPVTGRLDRVRQLFAAIDGDGATIDALLVTTPANIRWLTGFSGSAGLLMVTAGGAALTTDGRYRTQSAEQLRGAGVGDDVSIVVGGVQAQREGLNEAVKSAARIGLEADDVTWAAQRSWAGDLRLRRVVPPAGWSRGSGW